MKWYSLKTSCVQLSYCANEDRANIFNILTISSYIQINASLSNITNQIPITIHPANKNSLYKNVSL